MKKDRNVGMTSPYTMYPTYQGMPGPLPGMPMMQGMPMPMQNGCGCQMNQGMNMAQMQDMNFQSNNNQMPNSNIQDQINQLDRRVSRLEATLSDSKSMAYSNNTNYTDANYHMM